MKSRDYPSAVISSFEFKEEEMKQAVDVFNQHYQPDIGLKDILKKMKLQWMLRPFQIGKEKGFLALFDLSSIKDSLTRNSVKEELHFYFKNSIESRAIYYSTKYNFFYFKNMHFLINFYHLTKLHPLSEFLNEEENYAQPVFNTPTDSVFPWYVDKQQGTNQYQLRMFSQFSNPITDKLLLRRCGNSITMQEDGSHFINDPEELERLMTQQKTPRHSR